MKNEIEQLNLLYSVTISNIFYQYEEFKTLNRENIKKISNDINKYFIWLEDQQNINALNIITIANEIIKNEEIRKYILEENEEKLHNLSLKILSKIDYKLIDDDIKFDNQNMYIDYTLDMKKDIRCCDIDSIDFINKNIYSCNLIFKDLIKLITNNYDFSKKMNNRIFSYTYYLNFINQLNLMYYCLNEVLKGNRNELYQCSLFLLKYPYIDEFLFPSNFSSNCLINKNDYEANQLVKIGITKGLHTINQYYYIELPKYNYKNTKKHGPDFRDKNEKTFVPYITSTLSVSDITLLYKMAFVDKDYILDNHELDELEHLITNLKKLDNIIINSQKLTDNKIKLIDDSILYVKEYTKKHNLQLDNFNYCPNPKKEYSQIFLEFYIKLNNFDYKFTIRKCNDKLTWNVNLKNKKTYKINLYFKEDFKHILQAAITDF